MLEEFLQEKFLEFVYPSSEFEHILGKEKNHEECEKF